MKTDRPLLSLLLVLLALALWPASLMADTYDDVYGVMTSGQHRLPGSATHLATQQIVKASLEKAGLTVHQQSYTTQVPVPYKLGLSINDQPIHNVQSFGPNGLILPNSNGPIEGPVVYVGQGSLEELKQLDLKGSIALLDFSSQNGHEVFAAGALALVYVGDREATQWKVAKHFSQSSINLPRLYVDRSSLPELKPGYLGGGRFEVASVWEDRLVSNLWALIPGEEGLKFNLGTEELLVLSADLTTFGAIPGYSPDNRSAANAALLTDVAVRLAATPQKRSILLLFTGSHFNQLEGAREFYYVYDKMLNLRRETDTLKVRENIYRLEMKELTEQADVLRGESFFASEPSGARTEVLNNLRRSLRSKVAAFNFDLMGLAAMKRSTPKENVVELAELEEAFDALTATKSIWNDLQRQVSEGALMQGEEGAPFRAAFEELQSTTLAETQKSILEAERRLQANLSHQKLETALQGKTIVAHLEFDFARSDSPWVVDPATVLGIIGNHDRTSVGLYSKTMRAMGDNFDAHADAFGSAPLYLPSTEGFITPSFLSTPQSRYGAITVATGYRVNGLRLSTLGDPILEDGLPLRRDMNLKGLSSPLGSYLTDLSSSAGLSSKSALPKTPQKRQIRYERNGDTYKGFMYQLLQRGSTDPERKAGGALVAVVKQSPIDRVTQVGYSPLAFGRVTHNGRIDIHSVTIDKIKTYGVLFNDDGSVMAISEPKENLSINNLFYTYPSSFVRRDQLGDYGVLVAGPKLLKGANSNKFVNSTAFSDSRYTSIYTDRGEAFKIDVNGLLMTGADKEHTIGYGIAAGPRQIGLDSSSQSLKDYGLLNGHRYEALQSKGIINNSIAILDAESREYGRRAELAQKQGDMGEYRANQSYALSLQHRAYKPLRDLSNDMVKAVVVLMILLLPFSFSMERLLFGFTSIYHQIGGFIGLFLLSFFILYHLHPAFSLADAPVVIFLAFVIILMSALVIYIMMGKFKVEIRAMQGLVSKVHSQTKESSTALASVLIGISGMRNRPLKTFLTASTIVLLTFTILVFASFDSQLGVVETYKGGGSGVDRIEVHRPSFQEIPAAVIHAISTIHGENYQTFTRQAVFQDPIYDGTRMRPRRENLAFNPTAGVHLELSGMTSFENGELKANPELSIFAPLYAKAQGDHPPMMLPELATRELALELGDTFTVMGRTYRFAGTFSAASFDGLSNLDGTKLVPPDFVATAEENPDDQAASNEAKVSQLASVDTNTFLWLDPNLMGVTTPEGIEDFGVINAVNLYPVGNLSASDTATAIARIFKGPVYAKDGEGVRQFFFTSSLQGSGFGEVVVPLLLGGLIIFSSLMGSIVDREKEIFTFSALGLAPPDVATLFFAESAVYSVIGGVGGYLFSQMVAKFVGLLSIYGIFTPPEMNFSSLNSIYTILIVMGLVMLSTIAPAMKASKSANPGVARKWKMPEPEGNTMRFIFPFTVSQHDIGGILSFISEHFKSHGDASLGSFAAQNVSIYREKKEEMAAGESLGIQMEMSLAPFDLGLFQNFKMYSQDSDIPGIMEVAIELERTAGAPGPWIRSNRSFVDDLRNQFLLWRSLPVETVEHYCSQTEASLKA